MKPIDFESGHTYIREVFAAQLLCATRAEGTDVADTTVQRCGQHRCGDERIVVDDHHHIGNREVRDRCE